VSARKRKTAPGDGWVAHTREMRESPAWRYLPDTARRVLALFELEHMRCGGAKNGGLVLTYTAIAQGKVRRKSISLAIRQCEALGFLRITRRGAPCPGAKRRPSKYHLTYLAGTKKSAAPTHEWRALKTESEAAAALAGTHPPAEKARGENAPYARGENAPRPWGAGPPEPGAKTPLLSRYSSHSAAVDAPEASPSGPLARCRPLPKSAPASPPFLSSRAAGRRVKPHLERRRP